MTSFKRKFTIISLLVILAICTTSLVYSWVVFEQNTPVGQITAGNMEVEVRANGPEFTGEVSLTDLVYIEFFNTTKNECFFRDATSPTSPDYNVNKKQTANAVTTQVTFKVTNTSSSGKLIPKITLGTLPTGVLAVYYVHSGVENPVGLGTNDYYDYIKTKLESAAMNLDPLLRAAITNSNNAIMNTTIPSLRLAPNESFVFQMLLYGDYARSQGNPLYLTGSTASLSIKIEGLQEGGTW